MGKLERAIRIIFLALMFAACWLNAGTVTYVPLWNTILVVGGMALTGEVHFLYFPYFAALPTLFLLNMWLLLRPSRTGRILYRILMVLFLSFKWYVMIKWELWDCVLLAEIVVLSIGALLEAILVLVALFSGNGTHQAS